MPNDKNRYQGGGHNKPQNSPGISQAEAIQLKTEVARLKNLVEEHLAEKNQWNTEIRTWVGSTISIKLTNEEILGKLLWLDRYTVSIDGPLGPEIIHKAHIVRMRKY